MFHILTRQTLSSGLSSELRPCARTALELASFAFRICLSVSVFITAFACTTGSTFAQSPQTNGLRQKSQYDHLTGAGLYAPPTPEPKQETRIDRSVVPSNYEQAQNDVWKKHEFLNVAMATEPDPVTQADRPNFIEREKSESKTNVEETGTKPKRQNLGALLSNIGMNLAFVLMVGIGFIALAKQWIKPGVRASKKTDSNSTSGSLSVKEELVLDSKSKLRVIQWHDTEVLVASDHEGVRAMIPLPPAFSDAMDQVESEAETQPPVPARTPARRPIAQPDANQKGVDERLIQMLLESAKASSNKRKAS